MSWAMRFLPRSDQESYSRKREQRLDHRPVGDQQFFAAQLRRRHPFQCLGFAPRRLAAKVIDHEDLERDAAISVIMPQLQQRMTAAQLDAEFLAELAPERRPGALPGADLRSEERRVGKEC